MSYFEQPEERPIREGSSKQPAIAIRIAIKWESAKAGTTRSLVACIQKPESLRVISPVPSNVSSTIGGERFVRGSSSELTDNVILELLMPVLADVPTDCTDKLAHVFR